MAKGNRFLRYFPLLLDALRSADPKPMHPAEAIAWIREHIDIEPDFLTRKIKSGRQSIFENDVHWARFYLRQGGLLNQPKRGQWALTDLGRQTKLTDAGVRRLFNQVRMPALTSSEDEIEDAPAPEIEKVEEDSNVTYWLVGALWNRTFDQTQRFLERNIWENGYKDQYLSLVRQMRPGDRIAIKSSFVQKHELPFNVGGETVSAMRIKATGTVLENLGDGRRVRVAWDPPAEPRDWYFYTFRTTIVGIKPDDDSARRLIDFIFHGATQDYAWWLSRPYWVEKYGAPASATAVQADALPASAEAMEEIDEETEQPPAYDLTDIIQDGCFLSEAELADILDRWRAKKNLVLQGPPGTGKTWLAKRLGYAMIGSNDRETTRTRLRVVQFHPSLAYEDFVRGWRPSGDGRLTLEDGILMQAIEAAGSEPDRPFVLVIEEINRGNPAQIFGEMLTLLENTKRKPAEAIELAYRRKTEAGIYVPERVYVPENLYVIGTMNIADRSLALVDLALRRRFAFVDLEPRFGSAWRDWCGGRGLGADLLADIEERIRALNETIAGTPSLGPQFRIGHSFLTPEETVGDPRAWFRARVETEIGPLLDEYWYDVPDTARKERKKLLDGMME